ncbi:IgA-specific serine endopeptidase [Balamuthia mandrillaris]
MERGRPFPSSASFEGFRLRERPGLSAALPPKQLGEELLSAAAAGDLSRLLDAVVRLESGQDICNFNGPKQRTPLHLACLAGSEVCLDLLLRHTTMVDATDAKGKTALALAAKKGCTGLVLKLLQRNASHQAGDENGNTPLHQAAYHGHLETVRCLLDNGAEINPLNEILSTPLHFAAMCGHHAVCELLLQRGGDPNGKNKNSTSALHLAARNGYVACCRVLLQAGADVNCVDPYDQIPLHLAARTGHSDCIELMLEEGAHVNAMDTEGSTAFDWADDFGHGECAVLLWEKGALIKTQTGKETMRWSRPCASGDVPTMRYDHAMAPLGDRIVVFGGYGIPPRRSPLRKQLSMLSSKNKTQGGEEEERAAHMNDVYILDASMQVMSIGKQISMDERGKLNMELSNTRKGANLQLCGDGLTVEYIREEIAETSQPFRRIGDETIAYFEVTVLNQGLKGYIAIGLTDRNFPLNKQPGWVKQSYGYHGDDGQVYHNQGSGIPFGPRFGTGDVVGCGLNYDTGEVFFTKNGAFLGVGWTDARNKELFPSVGLHSPEEKVLFNFGKKPFKFNFDSEMVHWYSPSATGTIPAARSASTLLALDNRRLLLFGGYSPHEMYNDIHLFDAELFTWTHCQTQGLAPTWRDSSASIVRVDGKHSPSHISRSSSFSSPSLSFSSLSSLASSSASLASSLLSVGGSEDNGNGMTLTRSSLTEVRDSLNFGVSGKRKKLPWEEEVDEEEVEEEEEEQEEEEQEQEREEEELEVEELEEEEEQEENEPTDDEEEDYEEKVKGAEEDCKGCNNMEEEREHEHAIDGEVKKQRTERSTFEEQEEEEETEVTQTECLVQMIKEEEQKEERGGYSALLVFGGRFSNRCFNTVHRMYLYDEDVLQQQLQQQHQQQNSQPEEKETIPASSSSDTSPSSTSGTNNNTHNNRHQSFVWEDITAEIRGTPPRPRASHAAAVIGARLWIFGGLTEEKTLLNDVHVLDFEQMKWQKLQITGRPPTPRQNATLTAVGNRLFIFGGWDGRRQHNDIHVLDTGIIFLSSIRYFLVSYFSLCSLLVSCSSRIL